MQSNSGFPMSSFLFIAFSWSIQVTMLVVSLDGSGNAVDTLPGFLRVKDCSSNNTLQLVLFSTFLHLSFFFSFLHPSCFSIYLSNFITILKRARIHYVLTRLPLSSYLNECLSKITVGVCLAYLTI